MDALDDKLEQLIERRVVLAPHFAADITCGVAVLSIPCFEGSWPDDATSDLALTLKVLPLRCAVQILEQPVHRLGDKSLHPTIRCHVEEEERSCCPKVPASSQEFLTG
jgi:hypothetical protein